MVIARSTQKNDSLEQLMKLQEAPGPKLSIYLPTQRGESREIIAENKIRLKNALQKIAGQWSKQEDVSGLEQARALLNNDEYWRHRKNGLAIFISGETMLSYDLSIECNTLVHSGEEFILGPLIVQSCILDSIWVLNLNLKQPELYFAEPETLTKIEVSAMPGEMMQALRISDLEQEQQYHSAGNNALYHGHGGSDNKDVEVRNYMRLIDRAIHRADGISPDSQLIVAGTVNHVATFKEISTHNIFSDFTISGSFSSESEQLQAALNEYFDQVLHNRAAEFDQEFAETKPIMKRAEAQRSLLASAMRGQIRKLSLRLLSDTTEGVSRGRHKLSRHLRMEYDMRDLLAIDKLIQEVYRTGGTIIGSFREASEPIETRSLLRFAS